MELESTNSGRVNSESTSLHGNWENIVELLLTDQINCVNIIPILKS